LNINHPRPILRGTYCNHDFERWDGITTLGNGMTSAFRALAGAVRPQGLAVTSGDWQGAPDGQDPSAPSRPARGPPRRLFLLALQQEVDALPDEGGGVVYFVYATSLLIQAQVGSSIRKVTIRCFFSSILDAHLPRFAYYHLWSRIVATDGAKKTGLPCAWGLTSPNVLRFGELDFAREPP
jgi:hypothetical protein